MIIGITDRSLYPNEEVYLNKIDFFLNSEVVDRLIVREKDLTKDAYRLLIDTILLRNADKTDKLIVHTHCDIAKAVGVKRVHLPEALLPTIEEDQSDLIYSVSLHPTHALLTSKIDHLSFFLVSPIYETTCKPGCQPFSPKLLKALKQSHNNKMVLLGGLDQDKIIALKSEGYQHFALRSGLERFITSVCLNCNFI